MLFSNSHRILGCSLKRSYFIRTGFSLSSQKVKGGGEEGGTEIGKKEQGRSREESEQIRWEKTDVRAAYVFALARASAVLRFMVRLRMEQS